MTLRPPMTNTCPITSLTPGASPAPSPRVATSPPLIPRSILRIHVVAVDNPWTSSLAVRDLFQSPNLVYAMVYSLAVSSEVAPVSAMGRRNPRVPHVCCIPSCRSASCSSDTMVKRRYCSSSDIRCASKDPHVSPSDPLSSCPERKMSVSVGSVQHPVVDGEARLHDAAFAKQYRCVIR